MYTYMSIHVYICICIYIYIYIYTHRAISAAGGQRAAPRRLHGAGPWTYRLHRVIES